MAARTRGDQAFLLRDVELRTRCRPRPLLDQREHAVGGSDVLARDAQPVLRGQHLEIGGADARDRGEDDDFLVEAGGDRDFLRGARCGAVLAPEIDLVGGIERDPEVVALRRRRAASSGLRVPAKSSVGSSGAPTILLCASACMMRPMAAPMSRLAVCASSISVVSSRERKPRHQSSAGGAASTFPRAAR